MRCEYSCPERVSDLSFDDEISVRLHSAVLIQSGSSHLAYPDYDGGSPVIEFEVQVTNPDNSTRIAYRGRDLDCAVAGLLPGRPYLFQVRAFNRAGVRRLVSLVKKKASPSLVSRLVHGRNTSTSSLVPVCLKHREISSSNAARATAP